MGARTRKAFRWQMPRRSAGPVAEDGDSILPFRRPRAAVSSEPAPHRWPEFTLASLRGGYGGRRPAPLSGTRVTEYRTPPPALRCPASVRKPEAAHRKPESPRRMPHARTIPTDSGSHVGLSGTVTEVFFRPCSPGVVRPLARPLAAPYCGSAPTSTPTGRQEAGSGTTAWLRDAVSPSRPAGARPDHSHPVRAGTWTAPAATRPDVCPADARRRRTHPAERLPSSAGPRRRARPRRGVLEARMAPPAHLTPVDRRNRNRSLTSRP